MSLFSGSTIQPTDRIVQSNFELDFTLEITIANLNYLVFVTSLRVALQNSNQFLPEYKMIATEQQQAVWTFRSIPFIDQPPNFIPMVLRRCHPQAFHDPTAVQLRNVPFATEVNTLTAYRSDVCPLHAIRLNVIWCCIDIHRSNCPASAAAVGIFRNVFAWTLLSLFPCLPSSGSIKILCVCVRRQSRRNLSQSGAKLF